MEVGDEGKALMGDGDREVILNCVFRTSNSCLSVMARWRVF